MPRSIDPAYWQQRLDELAGRHDVPGATLAVWADGQLTTLATGVLHKGTGVEATPESLFQIGSITKVYTATLLMRLVEQGLVTLDTPVAQVLPQFRVADPEVSKRVTLRHLLCHTSGINGDFFHDTGRGDDCVARYVEDCAGLTQSHPLDATLSYCNTGFVILGRVIEQLTGTTWDAALAKHLIGPLGLTHTWVQPEDVLRFRAAMGHVTPPAGGPPQPAPQWSLMRSMGPAGLICATAADVVAFGRLHLDGGRAPDGTTLLTASSVAEMQRPQARMPHPHGMCHHLGLGWMLSDWGGRRVLGHDGDTIGQSASLRVVPDADVAVALLTNTDRSWALQQPIMTELLGQLCDVTVPAPLEPPADVPDVDLNRHVGVYERVGLRTEVTAHEAALTMRVTVTGELADRIPPFDMPLIPLTDDVLLGRRPDSPRWLSVYFYRLPDGARYMHDGSRATRRVD